jgi:hypothetical protein
LAPGQVFSIPFRFKNPEQVITLKIANVVKFFDYDSDNVYNLQLGSYDLCNRDWKTEPYKMTFDGYDNTVQFGIDVLN